MAQVPMRSLPGDAAVGRVAEGHAMTIDTSSEQHRIECEAREVARWPLPRRIWYYALVEQHRGKPAVDSLVAEVMRKGGETAGSQLR